MTIDKTLITVPETIKILPSNEYVPRPDTKHLITFKGDDCGDYGTFEALKAANQDYFARTTSFKVHDAIEGRREIAPGTGDVQVCVGFKKGRDEYGMRKETPVYRTQRF
ncbi:MAG: hypothetical protein Q7K45_02715 [Nanoarchaeota archaeon]|nr:hypothetical protein [Nanoarchaeota archaeon]